MPANLNALIRYKQIDSCLKNNYYGCSIFDLIEACSDALTEFRGTNRRISERTIRDDLRVMKSEMLGFNAPIEVEEGMYFYTDREFTVFNTPIQELEVLKEVFDLLKEKQKQLEDLAIDSILSRIGALIGEKEEVKEEVKIINKQTNSLFENQKHGLKIKGDLINECRSYFIESENLLSKNKSHNMKITTNDTVSKDPSAILWKEIFELI